MSPLEYFLVFLKASLFSTGGFGNLPSLHQDLTDAGVATDADFGQAIAVGQLSPGPNGLWVIALGYITYGLLGALLALLAISIPPFLVLVLEALHSKIEHLPSVQGVMRGISVAVVGLLIVTVWSLLGGGSDWRSFIFALGSFALSFNKKINVLIVLALAGLGGFLVYS
jgi:chromate transporter